MKLCIRAERKVWAVCMALGLTMLLAELIVAQRRVDLVKADPRPASATVAPSAAEASVVSTAPVSVQATPVATSKPEAPKSAVTAKDSGRLLVEAVIQIESGGNPQLVGKKGERGLMQVKRGTWGQVTEDLFGRSVPFDRAFEPSLNRKVGSAYLAYLQRFLAKHKDKWRADERSLLLACYNAGPNRVAAAGFSLRRLPASTQDYVRRATALHQHYVEEAKAGKSDLRLADAGRSGSAS